MTVVHKSGLERVAELFNQGLSDDQIVEKTGYKKQTVCDYRSKLGLVREIQYKLPKSLEPKFVPEPKPLMEMAKDALIGHLVEKPTGYYLNGRPVKLPEIILAANRNLRAWGLSQIGPAQWRVP